MSSEIDPGFRPPVIEAIEVNSGEVMRMVQQLGPEGNGFYYLSERVEPIILANLQAELVAADELWQEAQDSYRSDGTPVTQNFASFAVNFYRGDDSYSQVLPSLDILNAGIEELAHKLDVYFPGLNEWRSHDASFQKYPEEEGELSWHYDLQRHPQLIISVSLVGTGLFCMRYRDRETMQDTIKKIKVEPGDIMILRAPLLWTGADNECRVEHAVQALSSTRISATFRDNLRPEEDVPGANYINVD